MKNLSKQKIKRLQKTAYQIRQDIIKMLVKAGTGHTAGPLGMADVFAVLYSEILTFNPKKPNWSGRDRVVLSNGHICPVLYATLARFGFFPKSKLQILRKLGSILQGHPHHNVVPGIENSSGPLGQGVSQAVGMALAARLNKKKHKVYCFMSDGEQDEGQTWEAVMSAAKYQLNNLIGVIDRNYIQISGNTEQVMPLGSLAYKYQSFGWQVIEIDGHSYQEIYNAFVLAQQAKDKPLIIIANTIPGKGVKEFEYDHTWHGKAPDEKQAKQALAQLKKYV